MIRKAFTRGISLNYVAFVLNVSSFFVLVPIVVNYLGQSMYGIWIIANSVITYFAMFNLGMGTAVGKYTAEFSATKQTEKLNMLISSAFIMILCTGILINLIIIGLLPFLPKFFNISSVDVKTVQIVFVLMGLNVLLSFQAQIIENVFFGLQKVDYFYGFSVVRIVLSFSLTIMALHLGFGIIGIALASILSNLVLFSVYLLMFRRIDFSIRINLKNVSLATIKKYAPYSLRTFSLSITSLILYNTDAVVIGLILGAAQVTPYAIGYKICWYATYAFSGFSSVMFPQFSRLYALKDMNALRELFLRISKISMAIMTSITICLLFFGHSFINLWVGANNWIGLQVFCLFIVMDLLHAIGTPVGILLQGIGENKWFSYSEMANAALNLCFSILLGLKLGIIGVVLGTVIAHTLTSTWITPLLACRFIKLSGKKWILSSLLPPLLMGIPVGIATWLLEHNIYTKLGYFTLATKSALVIGVYFVFFVLCCTNSEDRRLFLSLFSPKARTLLRSV